MLDESVGDIKGDHRGGKSGVGSNGADDGKRKGIGIGDRVGRDFEEGMDIVAWVIAVDSVGVDSARAQRGSEKRGSALRKRRSQERGGEGQAVEKFALDDEIVGAAHAMVENEA
jgi:hypothetical protein